MPEPPSASRPTSSPPYSILAAGYDFVMSHVDYDFWAEYIYNLLCRHQPDADTVLELGCGTGSLAIALQPMGGYRYLATDISAEMIAVARRKADEENVDVRFARADFTDFQTDEPVDVVLLLYDGLNYILEEDPIRGLMKSAYRAVRPGGLFIVDQSTPSNSVNNEAFFEHSDSIGIFSFVRRSRYDEESRLHRTTLDITVKDKQFREEHVQRAYTLAEIRPLAEGAGFIVEDAYEGFSTSPATEESERAHWILRRPA